MKIKEWVGNFAEGWREGWALRKAQKLEALYITKCDNGHFFNAYRQSGICPHKNVCIHKEEFKVGIIH